jgi:hypothetical protein
MGSPASHKGASDPEPLPWRPEFAQSVANRLVLAAAAKVTGERLTKKGYPDAGTHLSSSGSATMAQLIDEHCATPYPGWPFPGPPPWVYEILTEITLRSGMMSQGEMQRGLSELGDQISQKAFGKAI